MNEIFLNLYFRITVPKCNFFKINHKCFDWTYNIFGNVCVFCSLERVTEIRRKKERKKKESERDIKREKERDKEREREQK